MRQTTRLLPLMVIPALFAGPLSAQSPSPSPTPPSGEEKLKWFEPPDAPPPVTTKAGPISRPSYTRKDLGSAPTAGPLKGMQALQTKDGEARLRVQGTEKTVRPGDVLGSDIVKSVSPGQMVLIRPPAADPKLGGALVIVRFDRQGRPRVMVISEKNPTEPPRMPEAPRQPAGPAQLASPAPGPMPKPSPTPSRPQPVPTPSPEASFR